MLISQDDKQTGIKQEYPSELNWVNVSYLRQPQAYIIQNTMLIMYY